MQLSTLDDVVATAIGRYLIRSDDWFAKHPPNVERPADAEKPTGGARSTTPSFAPGRGPQCWSSSASGTPRAGSGPDAAIARYLGHEVAAWVNRSNEDLGGRTPTEVFSFSPWGSRRERLAAATT